jgi:F0F1-type ATP synthase membrane subunit b/b'
MEIFSKIGEIVMQILAQLHADYTSYFQLVIFIVAISFLTVFVYNPYFKAADKRFQKTKGADAVAKDAAAEAKKLQLVYQTKAREVNNKIRDIYDAEKNKALKKSAEILSQAKIHADEAAAKARKNIDDQMKTAETEIAQISKDIAQTLTTKFEKGL